MGNLVEYAKTELEMAGLFSEDGDYDGMLGEAVLELVQKFAEQGHSGFSAGMVSNLFNKLSRYEPLGPLTGNDDEWVEAARGVFQNKRCSHIFKASPSAKAYTIQGIVFKERNGATYTGAGSRRYIKFPCMIPKSITAPSYLRWFYILRSKIQGRIYA